MRGIAHKQDKWGDRETRGVMSVGTLTILRVNAPKDRWMRGCASIVRSRGISQEIARMREFSDLGRITRRDEAGVGGESNKEE